MGCCLSQEEDGIDYQQKENRGEKTSEIGVKADYLKEGDLKNSRVNLIENRSDKLKQQGNEHFKKKDYKMAIKCYRQALVKKYKTKDICSSEIAYYTNLALAYKADLQFEKSIRIVDQMVANPALQTLQHTDLYRKGLLTKARSIMMQTKQYCLGPNFTVAQNHTHLNSINDSLHILEKLNRDNSNQELQNFLFTAQKIKKFITVQIIPKSQSENLLIYLQKRLHILPQDKLFDKTSKMAQHFSSRDDILAQIAETVEKLKKDVLEQEKDYLLDPITYEPLLDPVLVPSGTTYNRSTLLQHFKNNGYNDPITHQLFEVGQRVIVPNFNVKDYANEARKAATRDDLYLLKY